ncbi:hypothetical protein C8E03_1082 [Lachnotalea glycerini]|jgi:hypothetical protein|uniref:Uncharacterized protein n=1 Tax=Lachnotalea glycerini TaxID=1763509 RepID=A0A255K4V8_9FIRM|nr:hypothetical protein [Lachnotalea glycerini]OYO59708.1 hypothetical protein CG709_17905 [Lachnotalea glycerini]PXV88281.1 hypothetical protein C8E03_1082 [Lachnotalea glycerini]RDY30863.1 hypothetical protein CG710_012375 [Lachnotalea glycerini]
MSQEKVERYKKEKANRKKIIMQEKRKSIAVKLSISLVSIAAIGWIGYSAYNVIESNKPETVVSVNMDSINDYFAGLSADTAQ